MRIKVIGKSGSKVIDLSEYTEAKAKQIICFYSNHETMSLEY